MRNVFIASVVATILVPPAPIRVNSLYELVYEREVDILVSRGGVVESFINVVSDETTTWNRWQGVMMQELLVFSGLHPGVHC